MMKVKKTSWHYRLWRFGRESESSKPKDLCRYFWHIALVKILFPAVLAGFVLLGIGSLVYAIYSHPLEAGLIVMMIIFVAALAVGIIVLSRKAYKKRQEAPLRAPKEPGLFVSMVKAKKRSVCPLIEVIDE